MIPISHINKQQAAIVNLHEAVKPADYQELITTVQTLFCDGSIRMVIDLSDVPQLNLTTLFSLYSIASIANNQAPADAAYGWDALNEMAGRLIDQKVPNLVLCTPKPKMLRALQKGKFTDSVTSFDTLSEAIVSFAKPTILKEQLSQLTVHKKYRSPDWLTAVPV